jgi:uncharacterized oxidoreductase
METAIDLAQATVLITGGSEGIGKGLATRFLAAGSSVVVTGRNPEKLRRAADELPGLVTWESDIGQPKERQLLAERVQSEIPSLNILINNAGIQRRVSLAEDAAPWSERQVEIDILLAGPVHLNSLLIPWMLKHGRPSQIVDVTSGGAFIPQVFAPMYSACKAALHSYTVTLRHALEGTGIRVVELIPPAVQTELAGPGTAHGAPLKEFCDHVFSGLQSGAQIIGFGPTESPQFGQLLEAPGELFRLSATRFPVATYGSRRKDS